MDAGQRSEYLQTLEQVISERDPSYRMSSADEVLARKWINADIPLRWVLTAIRLTSGKPQRMTLRYFEKPVLEEIRRQNMAVPPEALDGEA